jgi:site-specific DNA recombinase
MKQKEDVPMTTAPQVAATYARVSTDRQRRDGISLDEQEARMLQYARQEGIHVPEEYRFREAASGLKSERQEYDKIRRLIHEQRIDVLIIYSSDRHTRDTIHGKIFRAELRRSRAQLHIVTEGGQADIMSAQGEFLSTLKDAFNQYWLNKILETTQQKKRFYSEQGIPFVQGQAPYGYRRVGKQTEARAEIVEEQAAIVRRIFQWADEGLGIFAISRLLEGTPTPGDLKKSKTRIRKAGEWPLQTIYRILRHEVYAGVHYTHREEIRDGADGGRERVGVPLEEWQPVVVPAIVERAQWERVQQLLDTGRQSRPRYHAKHPYLLARRARCGKCGYAIAGYPQQGTENGKSYLRLYYRCSTNNTKGSSAAPRCGSRMFRVPETDATVWETLKELLLDPQAFITYLYSLQEQQQREQVAQEVQTDVLNELIDQHLAELDGLAEELGALANRTGPIASALRKRMEALEADIERLSIERSRQLQQRIGHRVTHDDIRSVEELSRKVRPLLDNADFETQRQLIEKLDWHFTLLEHDGQWDVTIHWFGWEMTVAVPRSGEGDKSLPSRPP